MLKISTKKLNQHLWSEESGLTTMLILLCISNFVILPFFSGFTIITVLSKIFWFFLLVAGITSLAKSRKQMWRFAMIPGMFVLVNTTVLIFSNRLLEFIDFFINLSVFALLVGLVLVKVFENGPVTFHRVVGAIVVFMLIGNVWSLMYSFLFIQFPGSISFPQAIVDKGITQDVFLYFSYTTLELIMLPHWSSLNYNEFLGGSFIFVPVVGYKRNKPPDEYGQV